MKTQAPRRSDAILDPIALPSSRLEGGPGEVPEWQRRRQAWGDWIASLRPWDLFGGLTFDPRRLRRRTPPGSQRFDKPSAISPRLTESGELRLADQPMCPDVARARVRGFLAQAEDRLGRKMAAVVALEAHKNGWPHFHPLLSIEGGLQRGDVVKLSSLWFESCGYNRLDVPRDAGDVCKYASKYLVKGLDRGDVMIWPERGPVKFRDRDRLFH